MKTLLWLFACCALAAAAEIEEKETIRKSFTVPVGGRLEVDNVWGSIDVIAYNGQDVRVVVEKTLHAEDAESAAEAKRDVQLDLSESGNVVRAYVDGPFRCNCGDGRHGFRDGYRGHRERRYRVEYDFQIEVPVSISVDLSTVNSGHISVRGTSGAFDVENVNGGIEMTDVGGAGHVNTVNGRVRVIFARNPGAASSFKTLNGDVDVTFQKNVSADVRVKTFHGEVYTDFDVTTLPRLVSTPERKDGHFVYRSEDGSRFRIGSGGPEYRFETFNGSIKIRSKG